MRSTYKTYPGLEFSKHLHFPNEVMAIVKFVPLVAHMARVAGTHIVTRKSLQTTLKYTATSLIRAVSDRRVPGRQNLPGYQKNYDRFRNTHVFVWQDVNAHYVIWFMVYCYYIYILRLYK